EATNQATSKRRGDAEDLRAGSTTESTQTRSYPRRITDGSLAGHHNPDPDAPQNTASRGLVSPQSGPRFDKSAHLVNAHRAQVASVPPWLASGAPSDCPTIGGVPRRLRPAGGPPQRLAWPLPRPSLSRSWQAGPRDRWRPARAMLWPCDCGTSPRAPARLGR